MTAGKREISKRVRMLLACGCACLAAGCGLLALGHAQPGLEGDLLDAARGLLLGIAVALNFGALLVSRRRCA